MVLATAIVSLSVRRAREDPGPARSCGNDCRASASSDARRERLANVLADHGSQGALWLDVVYGRRLDDVLRAIGGSATVSIVLEDRIWRARHMTRTMLVALVATFG